MTRYSLFLASIMLALVGTADAGADSRAEFKAAWDAASRGDRAAFEQAMPALQDYLLYPYLQYEDYRHRRARVDSAEMADFLEQHEDWAFTAGLRKAWLKTLGKRSRWDDLLQYAGDEQDTEIRCYLAHARIRTGDTDGVMTEAQDLWTAGKSQPDPCDPVFSWLRKQGGVTSGLAWERIRRAMDARNPRLTLYLARYLESSERIWAERWQQQDRTGYRRLDQAAQWPDEEKSRDITAYGLRRLARSDPDRAWSHWNRLEGHYGWDENTRAGILREIALWSAVERLDATPERMRAVPEPFRDDKLMEWWVRYDLSRQSWGDVILSIADMSDELKADARWRYWDARARREMGDADYAGELLEGLSTEANYYGFLAADLLNRPYSICPAEPTVTAEQIQALREQPAFARALELRDAGIRNWSRAEWRMATRGLDQQGLREAAALANAERWQDMTIFALGNSGDLRWYDWRFPLDYGPVVEPFARDSRLDPAWVLGLMRSESAMAEDAISSANARGLMQVTPGTAKQLSKRHGIPYSGSSQLLQAETNIRFGTKYLRDLLDRFGQNTVLASGAYNAGPHVVDRWMKERTTEDPAIWVETLPYYETRDYIPRVLAFTTLYDWRLEQPVNRVSSRMPPLDKPDTLVDAGLAEVACRAELR